MTGFGRCEISEEQRKFTVEMKSVNHRYLDINIRTPKKNGYRSYHLILGVPVYCADTMEIFPVELQFRTMEMDLWASMEHRILYKGTCREDEEKIKKELTHYSQKLCEVENYFSSFRGAEKA